MHQFPLSCGVRRIGQVAKLLGACAELRLTRSGRVEFGEDCADGLEVTVREQQGRRMKHENGEGEMGRCDMRTAHTLSHACTRCLYVKQRNRVRKFCVRHGVRVHAEWRRLYDSESLSCLVSEQEN